MGGPSGLDFVSENCLKLCYFELNEVGCDLGFRNWYLERDQDWDGFKVPQRFEVLFWVNDEWKFCIDGMLDNKKCVGHSAGRSVGRNVGHAAGFSLCMCFHVDRPLTVPFLICSTKIETVHKTFSYQLKPHPVKSRICLSSTVCRQCFNISSQCSATVQWWKSWRLQPTHRFPGQQFSS